MKRYLALFTATLLLVANCFVYTPVKAVGTSVDFAEMFSEYLSLAEMSMALTQGIEIDWSNYEFDANATNQDKAKALMNYYYGLIYNGLDYFLDLSGNYDIVTEQVAAIALQTSGNLSSDNIQDLRSQVATALQNYAVTENWNIPIMLHYDDLCIANWNKYNSMYINQYLDSLDETVRTDYPEILDRVNLGTFYGRNLNNGRTSFTSVGYYEDGFSYTPTFTNNTYTGLKYPFIYRCLLEDYYSYWDVVGYQVQGINKSGNKCYCPVDNTNPTIISDYPIFYNIVDAINYSRTESRSIFTSPSSLTASG